MNKFKFDFSKVAGMEVTEAMEALFHQMEDHYNENIQPAPIVFGGQKLAAPASQPGVTHTPTGVVYDTSIAPQKEGSLIRVEPGYEIKDGTELGLKAGAVLVGVRSDTKAEIFDFLKNYQPEDQIVEGDSGKYDLGRK